MSGFVKSADTRTTVASSRAQLSKLLLRYGASAVSMSEDFEKREKDGGGWNVEEF